ncbi:DUF1641 domain-containing protein [Alteribacillus sp. HJP-4]|uniref:DUF1641 domain-containing protein n=1 Tax=Alteribacillus sp. HJP-4 TaxID=2775394 RepID=UPI0035CD1056
MAKQIKSIERLEIPQEEKRAEDLREIEDALIDNKDVILKSLDTLRHADDRGVVSLVHGLFADGDKVLKVIAETLDNEDNTRSIKHLLLLLGIAGRMEVDKLEPILLKINSGLRRVGEETDTEEKTGYVDLLKALKDPEVNRSITLLLTFLKGMGTDTEHETKTDEDPPDQKV